jgi:hypothetical protein
MALVKKGRKAAFDPKIFLAKVGDGKTISKYQKDQIVFSQGDVADAVFYIQKGKIKLTVVSERGKEAVVGILEPSHFFGEGSNLRCPLYPRKRTFVSAFWMSALGHKQTFCAAAETGAIRLPHRRWPEAIAAPSGRFSD